MTRSIIRAHVMRLFSKGQDTDALAFAIANNLSTREIQDCNDMAARAVAMGMSFARPVVAEMEG